MVTFFLPAPPQAHEPTISSTISLPICEPIFISPTSYRNSPMGPPPFISFPRNFCSPWGTHFTLGHLFLYLYIFPQFFHYFLYKHLYSQLFAFVVPIGDLLSFWPHATHVTLGWSITSHLPPPTSSISSDYYPDHLPFSSEFVHLVLPLAQLIPDLVVPLTLDLVTRLRPFILSYTLQPRAVLSLPCFLTSSMYLCHFFTTVDSTKPFDSGSRILLLSTSTHFSKRAIVS
jgi:hypothetical protein